MRICYEDDAEKTVQIIKKLIDDHPLSLKNREPDVFFDNLGESSVNIIARIWRPATEWYSIKKVFYGKSNRPLRKRVFTSHSRNGLSGLQY